jgi:nitrate reductase assembly molybdenum cofactor insertion protein NarJ
MKKKMNKSWTVSLFFLLIVALPYISMAQTGFTQKDRELLIRLDTKVAEMDKRFEQVDKRFAEMRDDMNKRFEQVDNRFGEMMTYIGILAAIFAAITVGTISFALWDRRTMVRPFESKVAEMDNKITDNKDKYESLISVLKDYASKNKNFAESLKQFNLF